MHGKRVLLHGGPHHGKYVEVPASNNHFHIMGFPKLTGQQMVGESFGLDASMQLAPREDTYSQVSGPDHQHDFEWDGWVSH